MSSPIVIANGKVQQLAPASALSVNVIRNIQTNDIDIRATTDLILGARSATINLNDDSNTSLSDFTATSIIGSLNELNSGKVSKTGDVITIVANNQAEVQAVTVSDETPRLIVGHDLSALSHLDANNTGAVLGLAGTGSLLTQFEVGRYGTSSYRIGARINDPTDADNEAAHWRLDRVSSGVYQGYFSAHSDTYGEVGHLFKVNDPTDGTISELFALDTGHCAAFTVGNNDAWLATAILYTGSDYGSFGLVDSSGVMFTVDSPRMDLSASNGSITLDATSGVSMAAGLSAPTAVADEFNIYSEGSVRIHSAYTTAGSGVLHIRFNGPEIISEGGVGLYLKTGDTADASQPGAIYIQPGDSAAGASGADIFLTPGTGTTDSGALNLIAMKTPVGGAGAGFIQLASDKGIVLQSLGGDPVSFNDSTYKSLPDGYGSIMHVLNAAFIIPEDGITDDMLRDSSALSVIGRSANSIGKPADISTTSGSFNTLRESGGTLGFGKIDFDHLQIGSSGDWFDHAVGVADNGVLDIGCYIDFHHTDGDESDFNVRLGTDGATDGELFINTTGKVWHSDNDGTGSGLDADLLDGANSDADNTPDTIVKRTAQGDVVGRTFRTEYTTTNPTINYFGTQIALGSGTDNYMRLSTPSQVRTALDIDQLGTGTYTPSPVAGSNITSAGSASSHTWIELQDTDGKKTCIVYGRLQLVTLTSTGSGIVYIPLPVSSNLTTANDLSGVGLFVTTNGSTYAYLTGDTTNNRAQLNVSSTTATNNLTIVYTFSYRVL